MVDCDFFNDILTPSSRFYTRAIMKLNTMYSRLKLPVHMVLPGNPARRRWKWTLLDLVLKTWNLGATNPRDRVYALLGLMGLSSQVTCDEVVVDYTATLETILVQTFVRGMTDEVNSSLDALYYSHPLTPREWPS